MQEAADTERTRGNKRTVGSQSQDIAQSETAQPTYLPLDNEVDVVDLWRVLARRSIMILVTFLGAMAAAATLSFLPDPVYEGRAVVEIGKVTGSGSSTIEDPSIVLRWIKEE